MKPQNGVYSLKWRLTDRYLRWGTLSGPRPGRADANQCKSSDFLRNCASRVSALLSVPHLLSREKKMSRRHCHFYKIYWLMKISGITLICTEKLLTGSPCSRLTNIPVKQLDEEQLVHNSLEQTLYSAWHGAPVVTLSTADWGWETNCVRFTYVTGAYELAGDSLLSQMFPWMTLWHRQQYGNDSLNIWDFNYT